MKMTTYQKWLRKKLKKNGEIRLDSPGTHAWSVPNGVVKITRIKHDEKTIWDGDVISKVEIDIEYRGTIKIHGDCEMGWDKTITPGKYRRWTSTISRNKRVRSCTKDGIMAYLKYFGVNLRWSSDLEIKKIVWKENNI
jgi:hypothetical protein